MIPKRTLKLFEIKDGLFSLQSITKVVYQPHYGVTIHTGVGKLDQMMVTIVWSQGKYTLLSLTSFGAVRDIPVNGHVLNKEDGHDSN